LFHPFILCYGLELGCYIGLVMVVCWYWMVGLAWVGPGYRPILESSILLNAIVLYVRNSYDPGYAYLEVGLGNGGGPRSWLECLIRLGPGSGHVILLICI